MPYDDQRSVQDWLRDIVLWGERLGRHVQGFTEDAFLRDEKTQDAVARCVEVIGEAAGRLMRIDPTLQGRHGLDLRSAYATRNRLSHGYHATDLEVLWATAITSVPPIVAAAKRVLAENGVPEAP
jgi:uncharacterized protein with HEPN domain